MCKLFNEPIVTPHATITQVHETSHSQYTTPHLSSRGHESSRRQLAFKRPWQYPWNLPTKKAVVAAPLNGAEPDKSFMKKVAAAAKIFREI